MKTFGRIIAVLLMMFVLTLPALIYAKYQAKAKVEHSVYPLTVQVVELDRENDIVTCADGAGNGWEFYGVEDWQVGDFASLLMDDNGTTETIYDDIVLMARYAGTFEN